MGINIYMVRTEVNKQPLKMHQKRSFDFTAIVLIWLATDINSNRNVIYILRTSAVSRREENFALMEIIKMVDFERLIRGKN